LATKVFLFKTNYGQDLQIEFEGRKKGKFKTAEKFVERIKKIQKETKVALEKVCRQETRRKEEV